VSITKLSLFNGALRYLKDRPLTQSEVTNNSRESARTLNAAWDDGALDACLEAGQWKFAMRSSLIDSSPSVEPEFGYQFAFNKPDDHVRTAGMYCDEAMTDPLLQVREEGGFWVANQDPIYVRYVSNDAQFGADFSLWPQSFNKFVQAHLASEVAGPLTEHGQEMLKLRKLFLSEALSKDAMADPTKFMPAGSWVRARGRSRGGSWPDGQPR
jgi:hypothetical protein